MTIQAFEQTKLPIRQTAEIREKLSIDQINSMYLAGEVRIVTEQARYPLDTIKQLFSDKHYILKPDFQRRHRWDVVKQSRLIESFIINVPIPPIFLYEVDYSVYEVMDGLQRITAIKDFYEDKYALSGLDMWPDLNGLKYSQLPEQVKKGIDRRYLSSIILLKETAKSDVDAVKLKQLVFSRINSGGAKLEDQELRNAQFSGAFNKMIVKLSRNDIFCEIFDIPQISEGEDLDNDIVSEELKNNKRFKCMKDVEIVLRFFAMRHIDSWGDLSLKEFLDEFSKIMTSADDQLLEEYKLLFESTISLSYDLFEEHAFCMWKKNKINDQYRWSTSPSMTIYDPMMKVLSDNIAFKDILISHRDDIINDFKNLCERKEELLNGRNTTSANVKQRINEFSSILSRYAN